MSNTERVLRARIQVVDQATQPLRRAISSTRAFQSVANRVRPLVIRARDMASRVLTPIQNRIRALTAIPQIRFILSAIDRASRVIQTVTSGLSRIGKMVVKATVGVVDKASSMLSSIGGKLTALAGGITIGVAVKMVTDGAMDIEANETSIRHFMGVGNKGKTETELAKMSEDYSKMLRQNANVTPFSTKEVMSSGTKALTSTGGNVAEAQKLLKRAEDMAGLTGKGLDQAVDALMDVNLGQYARLTEFGISAEGGAGGESPEDILGEIDRRFNGGAEKLSQTAKGKYSTATGTLESSLADFGTAFLPIMSKSFDGVTKLLNDLTPSFMALSEKLAKMDLSSLFKSFDFSTVTSAFQPLVNLFKDFFSAIENKSPTTQAVMDTLGLVFNTVFNMIGSVIEAVTPTIKSILTFIGEHTEEISSIVSMLGSLWEATFETIGLLLKVAWAICEPILDMLLDILSSVADTIKDICDWWGTMADKLSKPIDTAINVVKKVFSSDEEEKGKKSAFGTHRVVGNDVPYRLHDGEQVLTRSEADRYGNGTNGGINIGKLADTVIVREEADIKKIAKAFVKEVKIAQLGYGGNF